MVHTREWRGKSGFFLLFEWWTRRPIYRIKLTSEVSEFEPTTRVGGIEPTICISGVFPQWDSSLCLEFFTTYESENNGEYILFDGGCPIYKETQVSEIVPTTWINEVEPTVLNPLFCKVMLLISRQFLDCGLHSTCMGIWSDSERLLEHFWKSLRVRENKRTL